MTRAEELLEVARAFAKKTKWRGPFELECIATPDELTLIEINPRFPAWTYFATSCGVNLPWAMACVAMGRPLPAVRAAPVGKLLVRYCDELVVDWAELMVRTTEPEKARRNELESMDVLETATKPKRRKVA